MARRGNAENGRLTFGTPRTTSRNITMHDPLRLASLLPRLAHALRAEARCQVRTPGHPDLGAYLSPANGLPSPGANGASLLLAQALFLLGTAPDAPEAAAWRDIAAAAIQCLARTQRETGRFDLPDCNPDSGPDTAFLLQLLLPVLARFPGLPGEAVLDAILRRAAAAQADGGFHTPNHRWVVASAIALSLDRWPDISPTLSPVLAALLAEGPDLDADGCFLERSPAIYDPVSVRALLLIDEYQGWPAGRDAALANLAFDDTLLHPDGGIETRLSHRQDHGARGVPVQAIAPLLQAARVTGDTRHAARAAWLWEKADAVPLSALGHIAFELLQADPTAPAAAPGPIRILHAHNRIWRHRRGAASVSAFGGGTRLVAGRFGSIELDALRIGHNYMGHGRFVAETLEDGPDGLTLRSTGHLPGGHPQYWQPLGQPVPPEDWERAKAERTTRLAPPCAADLQISPGDKSLVLHFHSTKLLPGVPTHLALDFLPGFELENEGCIFRPQTGQVVFHRSGTLRLVQNGFHLDIEGGHHAYRTWQPRDFEAPGENIRLLLTFLSPVDHTLTLRWGGAG
jgi:hypothetical protein